MFNFLRGVVAGSGSGVRDLQYNIGEPYSSAWGSWTHHRGTSKRVVGEDAAENIKPTLSFESSRLDMYDTTAVGIPHEDGSPVSIFSLSGSSAQDGHLAAGRNGVKRLRTVRHPNILSFLNSTEVEIVDGAMTKVTIYMVTEPVMPLSEKIKELGLDGKPRDEYYAWGLHQIAKAVSFLNNDCKLVHANVCLASIVVTQTLDWKLHAFDVLSEFDGRTEALGGTMLQYSWLVGAQYKPMELAKSDWASISNSPPWAIDSWGMGCLIYELFLCYKAYENRGSSVTLLPSQRFDALLPDYQRLLSSMPSKRMNTSKLIENSEYFQNKLVDTIQFMEVLSLKDSVEKDNFFRKLPNLAEQLPRSIVLKKILPLLASALEFGSAAAPALTALLKMGSWLPTEEFSVKVLPIVVKLFSSNDRAIRVALLQHIDQFGDSLSAQVVDEQVYPHVANGFSDASAFLRELTLKSMLVLAPKRHLMAPDVNGPATWWVEAENNFTYDSNTETILVASTLLPVVGSELSDEGHDKHINRITVSPLKFFDIITRFFSRVFYSYLNVQSRLLIEVSIEATGIDACVTATKFHITVLCRSDEEPAIRTNTTILLGNIASYLNEGTRKRVLINAFTVRALPDTFSPARGAGIMALCATSSYYDVTEGETGETSVPTTGISSNSSLLGWAMSNLTLVGKTHEQAALASTGPTTGIASTTANNHSAVDIASTSTTPAPIRTVPIMDSVDQPVPGSPLSTDGWGELDNGIHEEQDAEKEGWDDLEPLKEPQPSPSLANIQAAQKWPVSQPIHPASHVKAPATDFQARTTTTKHKDDDEDLWGSIAAPPPRTDTSIITRIITRVRKEGS
ncbi:putative inactive serine/threonine-protein kinase scy1 [Drosera capensis]